MARRLLATAAGFLYVGVASPTVVAMPAPAVSTIVGGASDATVFATSDVLFYFGAASHNVFVGGSSASTIVGAAGGGAFFGGTHGDEFVLGSANTQVIVGTGGADTITGGGLGFAPTIFATGAEHMTLTAGTEPVTVVSFANGGVVDTSATAGDNVVFAGFGAGGNQTLVGSATGTGDTFIVSANPAATPTTISIADWHAGDVFYLPGYAPPDIATMDAAVAGSVQPGAAGLSFTLSDNTTIAFLGAHPTSFDASAAY